MERTSWAIGQVMERLLQNCFLLSKGGSFLSYVHTVMPCTTKHTADLMFNLYLAAHHLRWACRLLLNIMVCATLMYKFLRINFK